MDNFENTPNTPQNPSEQVESTVITPPAGNAPASVVSQKPKSKKNLLEIGILFVIIAILAGVVSWYFISKNQTISVPQESETTDQITSETDVQPTLVEVTPTMKPRELKILADCKMHNVNPDGSLTVLYENDDLCSYGNTIIRDGERYIYLYNRQDFSANPVLVDVASQEIITFPEDMHFYHYQPQNENVYSVVAYPTKIIYKGTLSNLKSKKLLEFDPSGLGRGGAVEDDFDIIPNSDDTLIIYQDTTSPMFLTGFDIENPESLDYAMGGMMILSPEGTRLLEVANAFHTRWLNNNSFVTLITNGTRSQLIIRKYEFASDRSYKYFDLYTVKDKSTFGEIYDIDVYNNKAVLSTLLNDDHQIYLADLSGETTNLVKYENAPARAVILNSDYFIGYGLTPCDPSLEIGSKGNFCTPADGAINDYKTDIRLYNIDTKKIETLLELDDKYLL